MECRSCKAKTSLNYGDGDIVLCKNCDYRTAISDRETNEVIRHEQITLSNYPTALIVARLLGYCGWFMVVVGVIVMVGGLSGFSSYGSGFLALLGILPGIGIGISGLLTVAAAEVTKAIIDTAENSTKIVNMMELSITKNEDVSSSGVA